MNKISFIISVVMNVGLVIVFIFGVYRVVDGVIKVG